MKNGLRSQAKPLGLDFKRSTPFVVREVRRPLCPKTGESLGIFSLLWHILSIFEHFWVFFGIFWAFFGIFCFFLGIFGYFWVFVGIFWFGLVGLGLLRSFYLGPCLGTFFLKLFFFFLSFLRKC